MLQKIFPAFLALLILIHPFSAEAKLVIRSQDTEFLTFEELKILSTNPRPGGKLGKKLKRFFTVPMISNEAYYRGVKPHGPLSHPKLGKILTAASWNIEKSYHVGKAVELWTSEKAFDGMIDPGLAPKGSSRYDLIHVQRQKLIQADILVLQEMDIGVKRSDYADAAKQLAAALDMNYAYAPEYLEIDPVLLGTEKLYFEDGSVDQEATDYYAPDPGRYKGVFGSAVLSRYPIQSVKVFPLQYQPYTWYEEEKAKTGFLENFRRFGSKSVFLNEITREMKAGGGRVFFRVDLHIPQLPEKTLTIINIHLEIKCLPKDRTAQMREILSYIGNIKNPVIVMGDFNAAPQDLSPTSVVRVAERTAKNPTAWFHAAVNYVSPHALVINTTRAVSNVTKNFQDPTAKHIPVVAPNPVKELFDTLEAHRFADGGVFDFRGDPDRSVGTKHRKLANSNQRDLKGFKTTFEVRRPIGHWVGKYRLDWVFVKSFLRNDPLDPSGPYRFAPHFGETLEEMNTSLTEQVSDHHPNIVYLPFDEPKL